MGNLQGVQGAIWKEAGLMKGADPYGASKAIRPWDGTSLFCSGSYKKAGRKPSHKYFEEVRGCLSCTLPPSACEECRGPRVAKKVMEREAIIQALRHGKSAQELAKERGMSIDSIKYYEKRYKERIVDPCLDCNSQSLCKAMGKPCVKKERWNQE